MSSAAPAFKDALLTQLGARSGLLDVTIEWGLAGEEPDVRERIYVGKTRAIREFAEIRRAGDIKLEEEFSTEVIVEVWYEGDDRRAAEERMWAIAAELEVELHDNPTVNATVRTAYVQSIEETTGPHDNTGWLSRGVCNVLAAARI